MLESVFMLLYGLLLMLRISPNGSFPPPLSAEDERRCIEQWLEGDIEARNTLIEHNLRLVAHIVKKYYTQAEDADDLISIGTIGLIKGINTYKPDKGVRLATYASRCCENEILMYFRSMKKTSGDVSLSDALDTDADGNSLSFLDIIAQDEDMTEAIENAELCEKLRSTVAAVLTDREERIIRLRFGLDGDNPKTQWETAKMCGISRSYVSRIEKKALEKLKNALNDGERVV